MIRDDLVKELQRRLTLIKKANGDPFDLNFVLRNPETEPDADRMPAANIFEFPDVTTKAQSRSSSAPPVLTKEFSVAIEIWYVSKSEGETTPDIMVFLKLVRQKEFSDGITLGQRCAEVREDEVSRVFRPKLGSHIVGIGQVLTFEYIEDFSNF